MLVLPVLVVMVVVVVWCGGGGSYGGDSCANGDGGGGVGVWVVEVMAVELVVCRGVMLVKRVVRMVRGDGDGGERELFMRFKSFFVTQVLSSSNLLGASWHCTLRP